MSYHITSDNKIIEKKKQDTIKERLISLELNISKRCSQTWLLPMKTPARTIGRLGSALTEYYPVLCSIISKHEKSTLY